MSKTGIESVRRKLKLKEPYDLSEKTRIKVNI